MLLLLGIPGITRTKSTINELEWVIMARLAYTSSFSSIQLSVIILLNKFIHPLLFMTTYSGVKKATAPIKHKKKFRPCKPAGLQGRNLYTAAVSSTASRLSQFSRMQRQVNAFASSAFSEKISVCISFTRALSPK